MHTTGWEGELLYKQEVEFIAHFLSIYFFDVVDHLLIMCYTFPILSFHKNSLYRSMNQTEFLHIYIYIYTYKHTHTHAHKIVREKN